MSVFFPWLRQVYFFKSLQDTEVNEIEKICHEQVYPEGSVIFKEDDKPDNFYIVVEGAVEVWKNYSQESEDLLAVHGPGNFFGEMALIDDLARSATVVTKATTKLLFIAKDDFDILIQENVSVAYSIMKSISQIIRNSNESFVANLHKRNKELEKANKELKEAQDELLKAERLSTLGKFSSMIIHDIKNPISIIKSYAEMIPLNIDDKMKTKKSSSNIIREAERLNHLAGELLDYSRGELRLNYSVATIENLITLVLNTLSVKTEKKNITVTKQLVFDGAIVVDFERIFRVLMNTIDNACKAMSQNGKLFIKVSLEDDKIVFLIKDDGEGMTSDVMERVFEPFYSSSNQGGTGLGMLVVKNVVEAHKGKLRLKSAVGEGTEVEIILPRKQNL